MSSPCEKIYLSQTYQNTLANVKIISIIKLISISEQRNVREDHNLLTSNNITKQLQKLCGHKEEFYKIILDKTIFHPQGGGQPCDEGVIYLIVKSSEILSTFKFHVKLVKLEDDLVQIGHYGWFENSDEMELLKQQLHGNSMTTGQISSIEKTMHHVEILANLEIDLEKRILYTKIHSAGHVLDLAVVNCGYNQWVRFGMVF